MKDHEIRELVNQLRDIAIEYHSAGQLRERIARTVRAAILQAQSDDDGEPTDDERIMAIEGIHNCERCSDEGWVVGEMGITRCACNQGNSVFKIDLNSDFIKHVKAVSEKFRAGNSPVIPGAEQRIADAVELLKQAAPAMLADNSGPDGPLAGRMKSPAIPDGYVMVPKVPTAEMISSGIAAHYERGQIQIHDRPAPGPMECAYVAMLAAALQEVKP
ncbi:hypothetical protein [Klebsiella variicola]|uniref:hypothetical protein n=1 Tax=Klebsiella variicola TaxID=244366 RepID=UPI0021C5C879|nr:hypothetical protein [Klebsiella variicola]